MFKANTLIQDRYRLMMYKNDDSYMETWSALDLLTNIEITIIIIENHSELCAEELKTEKIPYYNLHHPNIAWIYSVDVFDSQIYLVLPYYSQSADQYIGCIDETKLWHFILDVSAGLAYLHGHNIIHRNIRPNNIYEDKNGNFVISGYWENKFYPSTQFSHEMNTSYFGPELFASKTQITKAIDIWALGATLYEMCEGELPFFGQGGRMQLYGDETPTIYGNYSFNIKNVIKKCLAKDPWDRPTAEQLMGYAKAMIDGKQFNGLFYIENERHNGCCLSPTREEASPKAKKGNVLGSLFELVTIPVKFISEGIRLAAEAISKSIKNEPLCTTSIINPNKQYGFNVYSSIFAPAEIKKKSHLIVQVYLHPFEETNMVKTLAQESQKDAERRDLIQLQCKLKKGDKVDVLLNIYGESQLYFDKKCVIWQGSFTKCSFDYFVPKDIEIDELSCMALLTVNEIPVGEMRFITKIVDKPRQLNTEIVAHKFNKVFISYSHLDEEKVKFYHEGLELAKVPHFFDRSYLKAGDVFPQVIQNYINSADLFILFWSENAAKSEYVKKEREQALERAFPQVKPQQAAKLSIYPISIEPRAELPSDMKENYHFGMI